MTSNRWTCADAGKSVTVPTLEWSLSPVSQRTVEPLHTGQGTRHQPQPLHHYRGLHQQAASFRAASRITARCSPG